MPEAIDANLNVARGVHAFIREEPSFMYSEVVDISTIECMRILSLPELDELDWERFHNIFIFKIIDRLTLVLNGGTLTHGAAGYLYCLLLLENKMAMA